MKDQTSYHLPVMKKEAVDALDIREGSWYIDANLGGGGHTREILLRGGNVIGIDLDQDSIDFVREQLKGEIAEGRLLLFHSNFSRMKEIIREAKVEKVAGVLFDLGVSSHQLESAQRGFSFNQDGVLDMRMDRRGGVRASDLINGLGEGELVKLFSKLGEENFSKRIAKKIVEERKKGPILTTDALAKIILSVRRASRGDRTHPATRVFQALRIAINDELNSLREALPQAFEVLGVGGRLSVISFHSLEDRIVKNYFRDLSEHGLAENLFKKPELPSDQEVAENPRARSGKLRALKKLKDVGDKNYQTNDYFDKESDHNSSG